MQSLADPAKAACAGSGDGKSKWMRLSSKWTAEFLLDPACPEAGSWLQEQEQPWGIGWQACEIWSLHAKRAAEREFCQAPEKQGSPKFCEDVPC